MHSEVRPYLMDLGSANGTYLNNERIETERYYELLEKASCIVQLCLVHVSVFACTTFACVQSKMTLCWPSLPILTTAEINIIKLALHNCRIWFALDTAPGSMCCFILRATIEQVD